MADGTVPCVKKDMKGVRGKNGDEAHSRQLRVMADETFVRRERRHLLPGISSLKEESPAFT